MSDRFPFWHWRPLSRGHRAASWARPGTRRGELIELMGWRSAGTFSGSLAGRLGPRQRTTTFEERYAPTDADLATFQAQGYVVDDNGGLPWDRIACDLVAAGKASPADLEALTVTMIVAILAVAPAPRVFKIGMLIEQSGGSDETFNKFATRAGVPKAKPGERTHTLNADQAKKVFTLLAEEGGTKMIREKSAAFLATLK